MYVNAFVSCGRETRWTALTNRWQQKHTVTCLVLTPMWNQGRGTCELDSETLSLVSLKLFDKTNGGKWQNKGWTQLDKQVHHQCANRTQTISKLIFIDSLLFHVLVLLYLIIFCLVLNYFHFFVSHVFHQSVNHLFSKAPKNLDKPCATTK